MGQFDFICVGSALLGTGTRTETLLIQNTEPFGFGPFEAKDELLSYLTFTLDKAALLDFYF